MNRRLAHRAALALALGASAPILAADTVLEARRVAPFERIALDGPADLIFTQAARPALVIEAEPKLVGRIVATVINGELHFDYGPAPFVTRAPVRFHVSAPTLRALRARGSGDFHAGALRVDRLTVDAAGSGNVTIDTLDVRQLEVRQNGAGDIRAAGRADEIDLDSAQAGDVSLAGVRSRRATVHQSGSGDVALQVSGRLRVSLDGAGDVYVDGSPQVERHGGGSGELIVSED